MSAVDASVALAAFGAEAGALTGGLSGLSEDGWARPTRCAPWDVRGLLAHVRMATGRLPQMLAAPAGGLAAEVSAVEYYRPDERFGPVKTGARIAEAQAEPLPGPELLAVFAAECRQIAALCEREPAGRVVITRHGDPMLLGEFLATAT